MSSALQYKVGFHDYKDAFRKQAAWFTYRQDTAFTYTFENFFHPFVGELIQQLNKKSVSGLLDADYHHSLATEFFDTVYTSLTSDVVKVNHFPKEIDVSEGGTYANYNWELLFHIPLTIAVHLSKNQRYSEAQRWFHYIFDPTSNDVSTPVPQRFWKFLAFRKGGAVKQIDEQLVILSKRAEDCTPAELELKQKILNGYEAIKNRPFQPYAVARTRQLAFQYCVVMKYLDNLIAWGDSLFRRDTVESINEATQLYVLAANLLGQRPQRIPQTSGVRPRRTFFELKKQGLDAMGNALVDLEGKFPLNLALPQTNGGDPDAAGPLFGIGRTLYFCIPRNEKLLSYWDTVADRLFKIRHCMNIEGVVRQLALFDPPIDPGMLVKAAAAGIDIGSIVSGLNQPVTPVRALFLIQKTLEVCAEVRAFGAALFATIEKSDGERLALLRQTHEIKIQQMQQEVRFLQWKQAQETTRSLFASRAAPLERLHYYQRVLGLASDPSAPDTLPLNLATESDQPPKLTEANFDEAYAALVVQYDRPVSRQNFPQLNLSAEGRARLYLTTNENDEFVHLNRARDTGIAATICNTLAAGFAPVPDPNVNLHFWGIGGSVKLNVGTALVAGAKIAGDVLTIIAAWEREQAGMAAKTASYERRADDWLLQHNLAVHELMQIGRQILTSLISEQIAYHDYQMITQQIAQAHEVDRFLHEKFSNEELYAWMQGEIARLYYEYYRFAFDTARRAERTMKHELMRPEVDATDYIKFNYWDGGRKGLLSGEALYLDVKRMEMAYHENNKRELELTKYVSLRQLNPVALLTLKATGTCQLTIPEWLYDLDCPGHYMRRIKSVALSIPSIVGPYTGINCTVSLLKSSVRKSPVGGDDYARQGSDDNRFVDYIGAVQSIVTSTGQNDRGIFETSVRDQEFLPFECAGAESTWKLDLPKDYRAFDYNSIPDCIIRIDYTARQGVEPSSVKAALDARFQQRSNLALLFSLRHDFPTEWSKFVNGPADLTVMIRRDYFPYFTQGKAITIAGLDLYDGTDVSKHQAIGNQDTRDAATDDLADANKQAFNVTMARDTPGLTRAKDAELFLIIGYSVG